MPRKCVIINCHSGYLPKKNEPPQDVMNPVFGFPDKTKHPDQWMSWVRFVNRKDWTPGKFDGIYAKHFESQYIKVGSKRSKLTKDNSVKPTICTEELQKLYDAKPSLCPTSITTRKKPTDRNPPLPDEMKAFVERDRISDFTGLIKCTAPVGFSYEKFDDYVLYYKIVFGSKDEAPYTDSIKVDRNLHVKLHHKNSAVPLPSWFRDAGCKMTRLSMLENFAAYIGNIANTIPTKILDEMKEKVYYNVKGRGNYSFEVIRFALMQRYTSRQAYSLLLNEFPLPSISYLRQLSAGGVDAIKAATLLREEGKIREDVELMLDEMYLQKSTEFQNGNMIGKDETGEFYKGILVLMIVGLKNSTPCVVKACPEVSINGDMVRQEIEESISSLTSAGFNVRAVVADNHASNVSAFTQLWNSYGTESDNNFHINFNGSKIYLMYDSVHLVKNVRNNLVSAKRFIFPQFEFYGMANEIKVTSGDISWALLHKVHEKNEELQANLRKAPKINSKTLHPGDNKQDVKRALNIFHETTSAAIKDYFQNEKSASEFLNLFNTWWLVSNSKSQFSNIRIGDAAKNGDGKVNFLRSLALWIKAWQEMKITNCQKLCLTEQTSRGLIVTLNSTASLIEDLLSEGYKFVLTSRFQSDPIERRFSRYRQMSGGRFLVGLREVQSSEKILKIKSLLKAGLDFWKLNLTPDKLVESDIDSIISPLLNDVDECHLDENSTEVAVHVAGYITKKLKDACDCEKCHSIKR